MAATHVAAAVAAHLGMHCGRVADRYRAEVSRSTRASFATVGVRHEVAVAAIREAAVEPLEIRVHRAGSSAAMLEKSARSTRATLPDLCPLS